MRSKWCPIYVFGDNITKEQARSIILRTNYYSYPQPNGPTSFFIHDVHTDLFGRVVRYSDKDYMGFSNKMFDLLKLLNLYYLHNDFIDSFYIGGMHGWCNWSGEIRTDWSNPYNIGKHPSSTSVLEEWQKLAKEFPFLNLQCWIFDHPEDYPEAIGPAAQFKVADGKAVEVDPSFDQWKTIKDHYKRPEEVEIGGHGFLGSHITAQHYLQALQDELGMSISELRKILTEK